MIKKHIKNYIKGYYFITDAGLSKAGNISDVRNAVEAGVGAVQYRNKEGTTKELIGEAEKLKHICKAGSALFIVNDRVDVALAVDADGIHIGQDDMPYETARNLLGNEKKIGVTVHNVDEARHAEKSGADYVGASPVFGTTTKADAGETIGIFLIKEIKKSCKIPIVAIGGINLENAKEAVGAGADALCAISAVVKKKDVKEEIRKFQELFK